MIVRRCMRCNELEQKVLDLSSLIVTVVDILNSFVTFAVN